MRPMASNGMASSPSFPPNFLLHMQQTPPPHEPQEHYHHHHHEHHLPPPPHHHPGHNPFRPSLQDFRGGMAPILGKQPMYGGDGGGGGDEVNGCGGGGANDDELSDDGSQAGEKKRRLNVEQVRTLEKNYVLGNNLKLSPEPKMQLARWLQNSRARLKTKQLEKDYDKLQAKIEEHKKHGNRYAKRSETAENNKGAAAGGQSGQSASTVSCRD